MFKFIRELNRFVEVKAPWKLAKLTDEISQRELRNTLAYLIEGIRLAVQWLQIVIPESSSKVMAALAIQSIDFTWNPKKLAGLEIKEKLLLFPKIEA